MTLQQGQILNNRYRIVKLIGQGGFGAVYRAWDLHMNSVCVIKENLDTSPEANRQFIHEAQILFRMKHPGLPSVFDYFDLAGQGLYLVMEYIEGQNLEEIIHSYGPLSESDAVNWISQVCEALEYLHGQNPPVIHRDIKPQNIILTPQGRAVLVDFGVAKVYQSQQQTTMGARAVTPGFSPPEQYMLTGTDERSDIYSLGATLYTLLTGQIPPEAMARMLETELIPVKQFKPTISTKTISVIERALAIKKSDRFASVKEMCLALAEKSIAEIPAKKVTVQQKTVMKTMISETVRAEGTAIPQKKKFLKENKGVVITLVVIIVMVFALLSTPWLFGYATGTQKPITQATATQKPIAEPTATQKPIAQVTATQNSYTSRTLAGHTDWVNSVAFSPDGRTLASGARDRTIKLWDVNSGTVMRTLIGNSYSVYVYSVAFSPDGRTLASGSSDVTVEIWDVENGSLIRTLKGHIGSVFSVAFSPDGRTLASGSGDNTIKLWDVESGSLIRTLEGHTDWVYSVSFSPDGRTLASGSDDHTIKLWDVESGSLIRTLEGHTGGVNCVAFSPDGSTLASGSIDETIKLWDAENGSLVRTLTGHNKSVTSIAFSPDGHTLASGSADHTIKLWDVESGSLIQTLEGRPYSVSSIAFSPDGRILASGSVDETIKLWSLP
ncbi:MAG: serine/threonine-protein kinase [Anaerolineaceae bacterium]